MTTPTAIKRDEIIRLVRRKNGASLEALTSATGWAPHSIRAAISGLRKAGYRIEHAPAKPGGKGAVYRMTAAPVDARRA